MAIRLSYTCDQCDDESGGKNQTTEGRTVRVALDGQEFVFELCEEHEKRLLDPLRILLDGHGRKPDMAPPKPPAAAAAVATASGKSRVPVNCPKCHVLLSDGFAARAHLSNKHGLTRDEALEVLPLMHSRKQIRCPHGCGSYAPQGYSLHMRASHPGEPTKPASQSEPVARPA